MKMAVFFIENAFCVGLFQSFYDGGDLDENGCFLYWKCVLRWTFSIILWWGRSWWKWLFSLSKTRFALDFFTHFSMGAILMKMAVFLKQNAFCVGLVNHFTMRAILMKMAVFVTENAFCVGLLLGCDLDENSCFPLSKMRFSLDFLMTWWHIAMANDDVRPDGDQVSGKVLYQSFLLHVWTYDRFCISHLFNMLENERAENERACDG